MTNNIHIQKAFNHMHIFMLMGDHDCTNYLLDACNNLQLPNRMSIYACAHQAEAYLARIDDAEYAPDIFLLDLSITTIDMMLLISDILDNDLLKHVHIYACGIPEMDSDIINAYDCGIRGYVIRPSNLTEAEHTLDMLKDFWQIPLRPDLDQLLLDGSRNHAH